jgi:superfamily II DNA helicase RecQ
MQIKIYTIPIVGGESLTEDMNVFLRSKKILQTEMQLITDANRAYWSFCIRYIEDVTISDKEKPKVDYRLVLDEPSFNRFSKMREIRKKIAVDEAIPAYAIFNDEELAGIAKLEDRALTKMKTVKGIGEKKVEKYGQYFIKIEE